MQLILSKSNDEVHLLQLGLTRSIPVETDILARKKNIVVQVCNWELV